MKVANAAAVNWNRNNADDAICVYTADMVLAGVLIGVEQCGLEADTVLAGGYAACVSHVVAVRSVMRAVLNGQAVR
jgi:hypothetical protein